MTFLARWQGIFLTCEAFDKTLWGCYIASSQIRLIRAWWIILENIEVMAS